MLVLRLQVGGIDVKGAIAIAWSPKGGLMQTFERPDREKGNAHKNLKVDCLLPHCLQSTGAARAARCKPSHTMLRPIPSQDSSTPASCSVARWRL